MWRKCLTQITLNSVKILLFCLKKKITLKGVFREEDSISKELSWSIGNSWSDGNSVFSTGRDGMLVLMLGS